MLNIFAKPVAAEWCLFLHQFGQAKRCWRIETTPSPSFEKEGDSKLPC